MPLKEREREREREREKLIEQWSDAYIKVAAK